MRIQETRLSIVSATIKQGAATSPRQHQRPFRKKDEENNKKKAERLDFESGGEDTSRANPRPNQPKYRRPEVPRSTETTKTRDWDVRISSKFYT